MFKIKIILVSLQAFAIDLVSHLSIQYALPKSYSTARLAVNTLSTLLSGTDSLTYLAIDGHHLLPFNCPMIMIVHIRLSNTSCLKMTPLFTNLFGEWTPVYVIISNEMMSVVGLIDV